MLLPNFPMKTFGGKVFWRTIESSNGWRLQQKILSEHYRIIDSQNIRHTWSNDWQEINHTYKKFTGNFIE